MRKRFLSFLLAASAAFCFIFSSGPEAQAIVPLGLVQSALASYVTSAGYKMWSENGGGELMVDALSTLYQSWLDSTDPVGALTLGQMSENDYVYLDNSGQIVIRKAAADMFQQFSDWIQAEYSVPVGSDTPTAIVSGGPVDWSNGNGVNASLITCDVLFPYTPALDMYHSSVPIGSYLYNGSWTDMYLAIGLTDSVYASFFSNSAFIASSSYSGGCWLVYERSGGWGSIGSVTVSSSFFGMTLDHPASSYTFNFAASTSSPLRVPVSSLEPGASVGGLGVTLAQAVADVVGQAKDDDAVVIGVGASAGATAQDIADMVAQGVKAQTLDPSVSITAEAVIDTPVQPYPDIDGLGLPTLGAALVDRFPFCIPWDFVDTVKLLSADPRPINIKVDLIPQRIKTSVGITSDTSFDIDLSGEQYAKIGVFCRWGSLITFCFGLFLLTKRLVWTA